MSNYRDDVMETAIVSDHTWLNLRTVTEEFAKATATTFFFLSVLVSESAAAQDSVFGYRGYITYETTRAEDLVYGNKTKFSLTSESTKAKDYIFSNFSGLTIEQATLMDSDLSRIRSMVNEQARAKEFDLSKRYVSYTVQEKAKAWDRTFAYQASQVIESAQLVDSIYTKLQAFNLLEETLTAIDTDISAVTNYSLTVESIAAYDAVFGMLNANSLVIETAYTSDQVLLHENQGQAWVANTDTWAMSRYAPFAFDGVAVINGKLYTWNDQGVYLSSVEGESIAAKIKTGKLDFGDALVHPTTAYLEYQLSGENKALNVAVTTTQSGQPVTYQYLLPKEQSDYLTNGRVLFGRGLRGRHFSFDVALHATSAQINALSIEYTPTARRT